MSHQSPKVNNPHESPKVNTGALVGRALRKVVERTKNPVVEAIFEEMGPEIDGLLQQHLGNREVDEERLVAMQNGLNRAGRVVQKIANLQNGRETA